MRFTCLSIFLSIFAIIQINSASAIEPGNLAPDFAISATQSLKSLKGKVVYVDFWASWCGPCSQSLPWLSQLANRYDREDFVVVAVNLDTEAGAADELSKKLSSQIIGVKDPSGDIAKAYNLQSMPSSYLIGRDGKILKVNEGFYEDEQLDVNTTIERILTNESDGTQVASAASAT